MKSSSRLLLGFGIGIAVLVLVVIILVLILGQKQAALLPENTPQGTVQRYLLAIQQKDYAKAFAYLSQTVAPDAKIPYPTYDSWLMSVQNSANTDWMATLGEAQVNSDNATVNVVVQVFRPGGPFNNPVNSHTVSFFLQKQAGNWMIQSPTDVYWIY